MAIPVRMTVQRWQDVCKTLSGQPENTQLCDMIAEEVSLVQESDGTVNRFVTVPILLTAAQRKIVQNITRKELTK